MTRRVWLIFLAPPVLAMTYFGVIYIASEAACASVIDGFDRDLLRVVLWVSTALAVAAFAGALVLANRLRRRNAESATTSFMGVTALVLAALFGFFVVLLAAPIVGSSLC